MHEGLARHFAEAPVGILEWPTDPNRVQADLDDWCHGPTRTPRISAADQPPTDGSTVRQAQYAGGWREYGYGDDTTPWPPDTASE